LGSVFFTRDYVFVVLAECAVVAWAALACDLCLFTALLLLFLVVRKQRRLGPVRRYAVAVFEFYE
jgi:hypothetical protein